MAKEKIIKLRENDASLAGLKEAKTYSAGQTLGALFFKVAKITLTVIFMLGVGVVTLAMTLLVMIPIPGDPTLVRIGGFPGGVPPKGTLVYYSDVDGYGPEDLLKNIVSEPQGGKTGIVVAGTWAKVSQNGGSILVTPQKGEPYSVDGMTLPPGAPQDTKENILISLTGSPGNIEVVSKHRVLGKVVEFQFVF